MSEAIVIASRSRIKDLGGGIPAKKHPEYRVWMKMKERCYSRPSHKFRIYGERGIKVCPEWRKSFWCFFADMGPRPSPKHQIDRIDNDGDYEPSNCRWVTQKENARNKRNTRTLTFQGRTLCIGEWCELLGWPRGVIYNRVLKGWSVERTLTEPPRPRQRSCRRKR